MQQLEKYLKVTILDLIKKSIDIGLIIVKSKTKCIKYNVENTTKRIETERVETCKFLGVKFYTTSGGRKKVKKRLTKIIHYMYDYIF